MTYVMRKGHSTIGDLADGHLGLAGGFTMGAKTVYYVDGNLGNDANDGKSWEEPFATLTVALAASHADISSGAQGWAARNVIYCKGDALDEDLVLLAQKTDVVGVGSYNAFPKCCLVGNHVPTGATASYGTRFFNFMFIANSTGGDIWTLDTNMANLEFHNCIFYAGSSTAATAAIVNTGGDFLGVFDCEFVGLFTDATIEFGAGDGFRGCRIEGNYIEGANNGIELNSSTTASSGASLLDGVIKDNVINVAAITIDDNADIAYIINNTLFTDDSSVVEGIDCNVARAANNYLVTAALNQIYPPSDTDDS